MPKIVVVLCGRCPENEPRPPLLSGIMSMGNIPASVSQAVRSVQLQTLHDWNSLSSMRDPSDRVVHGQGAMMGDFGLFARLRPPGLATRLNQAVALAQESSSPGWMRMTSAFRSG
jgi:hypothetical protein